MPLCQLNSYFVYGLLFVLLTQLALCVGQLMTDIAVDITAADGERNCDDELSTEIADDDDKLRI